MNQSGCRVCWQRIVRRKMWLGRRRALSTLTPRQRAVLKLQFSEGLGRTEIATRLESTERAIKRDLLKSYERLRRELKTDLLRVLTNGRE